MTDTAYLIIAATQRRESRASSLTLLPTPPQLWYGSLQDPVEDHPFLFAYKFNQNYNQTRNKKAYYIHKLFIGTSPRLLQPLEIKSKLILFQLFWTFINSPSSPSANPTTQYIGNLPSLQLLTSPPNLPLQPLHSPLKFLTLLLHMPTPLNLLLQLSYTHV